MLSNRQSILDRSNCQREPGLGFPMSYSFFCDLFVLQTCGLTYCRNPVPKHSVGLAFLDHSLLRYYRFSTTGFKLMVATGKLDGSSWNG